MKNSHSEIQLATITDKSFFQGTLVMIHSFLVHNGWFQGKILIIEDDLNDYMKSVLSLFPKIDFPTVSQDLHIGYNYLQRYYLTIGPKLENSIC